MRTYKYDIRLDEDMLPMLVRECSVTYRAQMKHDDPDKISEWLINDMDMKHLAKETVVLLMYDTFLKLIGVSDVSVGSSDCSVAMPKEIFRMALAIGSSFIVLAHNHPSGDPIPSKEDMEVFRRVKEAGQIIGIPLIDFIITGRDTFWSANRSMKSELIKGEK